MTTQDTLLLHTGRSTQLLQPGQAHTFRARAGERYRIVRRKGETEQLVDNVIARRVGDDLHLSYLDGTRVTLQNYYEECKALVACEVALPASPDQSYRPGAETAPGVTLSDGSRLVYAHGAPDALQRMAGDDAALRSAIADLRGERITYIPSDERSPLAYGLFPAALLFLRETTRSSKEGEAPSLPATETRITDDIGPVTRSRLTSSSSVRARVDLSELSLRQAPRPRSESDRSRRHGARARTTYQRIGSSTAPSRILTEHKIKQS